MSDEDDDDAASALPTLPNKPRARLPPLQSSPHLRPRGRLSPYCTGRNSESDDENENDEEEEEEEEEA